MKRHLPTRRRSMAFLYQSLFSFPFWILWKNTCYARYSLILNSGLWSSVVPALMRGFSVNSFTPLSDSFTEIDSISKDNMS